MTPATVSLDHGLYGLVPGGLRGRYYKNPDFTDEILQRVDPFIHFWDERKRSTPMVIGAKSARWEGALYVGKPSKVIIELAVWHGPPATATLWINGEKLLEYPDPANPESAYVKRPAILTKGLHAVALQFSDPRRPHWSFMFFTWKPQEGHREFTRELPGPGTLYYPRPMATTFYSLNGGEPTAYTRPFALPPGENLLRFWSISEAGLMERKKQLRITIIEP